MQENKKQKFVLYAVPCNKPFVISKEEYEAKKDEMEKNREKFLKRMKEIEKVTTNIKFRCDEPSHKKVLKPEKK